MKPPRKPVRLDVRQILEDPSDSRELLTSAMQAAQSVAGIEISREDADRAYEVINELECASFFNLAPFTGAHGQTERRPEAFRDALAGDPEKVRVNVRLRDFLMIEGAPLVYTDVTLVSRAAANHKSLGSEWAHVAGGLNPAESNRFVRSWWEQGSTNRTWVPFSKGGVFARFCSDLRLVFDWTDDGREFRQLVKRKYGSESRFVKSRPYYFKRGITWTEKSYLGFSARVLDEGAIFSVSGPAAIPRDSNDEWYVLGLLNSLVVSHIAHETAGRNFGASYVSALPISRAPHDIAERINAIAQECHDLKRSWQRGDETSRSFDRPWLLLDAFSGAGGLCDRLANVAAAEEQADVLLNDRLDELNELVFPLYGIDGRERARLMRSLRYPREKVWLAVSGEPTQKRMEHVFRLLSFVTKRVVASDPDGIVPFETLGGDISLIERIRAELRGVFGVDDGSHIETEITNELKKQVKNYRRSNSITEWLENVFFEYHASLYDSRPIIWHISSAQLGAPAAFNVLVDYLKFDANRMAKLRGRYLAEARARFRREAALS